MFSFVCGQPDLIKTLLERGYEPRDGSCAYTDEWTRLWDVVRKKNDFDLAKNLLDYVARSTMSLKEKKRMFHKAYEVIIFAKDSTIMMSVLNYCTTLNYVSFDDIVHPLEDGECGKHLIFLLEWTGPNGERYNNVKALNEIFVNEIQYCDLEEGRIEYLLNWRGPHGERVDPTYNSNKAAIMACYECDDDTEEAIIRKLKFLAKWRGPNGEFVDFRSHDNCAFRYACIYSFHHKTHNSKLTKFLLEWRGPNGEFVDLRNRRKPVIKYIFSGNMFKYDECLRDIIEWVGPNGETVDLNGELRAQFNTPVVLTSLLKWRNSKGEVFDPTENNHYLLRNANQEVIPYLTRHYLRFEKWNNPTQLSEEDRDIYKILVPVILKTKTLAYMLFKRKKCPKDLSLWIIQNYIHLMV